MGKLEIRLLGRVDISKSDASPRLELTHTCQKLLAYLLLNTGKMCRREVLMDIFWSESNPERARSCLNSALWRLRRELKTFEPEGANYLVTTDLGEVGFNWECNYWLDVQMFERELTPLLRKPVVNITAGEAVQLENTVVMYRGELLEGIYDNWTLIERERLRIMYINTLTQLMNYHANCNCFEKSIEFARAILKEDPLREDIHRNMMRLYASVGQRALGVQQYRTCSTILDTELGVPPMEETQMLYQQLIGQSPIQKVAAAGMLHTYNDLEQHLQTIVHSLDQAYALLRQAAHLMEHYGHVSVDT